MLIEEYFQQVETLISSFPLISESRILKDKRTPYVGLIEGRLRFLDGSQLLFVEFVEVKDEIERYRYSYHFQDSRGTLQFRYDNAPHHRDVRSFPHHKHTEGGSVQDSEPPDLSQVLHEIGDVVELRK